MIVEYKKEASRQELIERIEELKKETEELKKENKSKTKIVFKSILECLKMLLWFSFIGISITLIGKFIPIVLYIALPIIIICLFITIYNTNKGVEKDE